MSSMWAKSEGDSWYLRNKKSFKNKFNLPIFLLDLYSIKPKKVLEIGASNGFGLAQIHEKYSSGVTAVEPSKKAVKDGKKQYPFVRFINSTCEKFNTEEKYDLIIVNFVFHWIYREDLYTCVNKIDKFLEDGKYLIIGDFGTEYFFKRQYHHLKDADFFTWKMPYWELFTKSGKYLEIAKIRFNHDNLKLSPDINIDNMGTGVLLKKKDMYIEL